MARSSSSVSDHGHPIFRQTAPMRRWRTRASDLDLRPDGSSFSVRLLDGQTFRVETPLVARYNVSNCLAAITVGYLRGVAPEIITRALATFPGAPGRMKRIEAGQPYMVVDYAHTADSLEKALIVVFGSAGAEAACDGEQFTCVVDRRKGIQVALEMARAGDIVLLAEKGHEQSVFVGKEKAPWADPTVARETLAAIGYTGVVE